MTNPELIKRHKNCNGILEFDSFGNVKCMKCKKVYKTKEEIECN